MTCRDERDGDGEDKPDVDLGSLPPVVAVHVPPHLLGVVLGRVADWTARIDSSVRVDSEKRQLCEGGQ